MVGWRENPRRAIWADLGTQGDTYSCRGLPVPAAGVEARSCTLMLETQAPPQLPPQQFPWGPHIQGPMTSQVSVDAGSLIPGPSKLIFSLRVPVGARSRDRKLGGLKQQ